MARVVVLDSGPLSDACRVPGHHLRRRFEFWLVRLDVGAHVVIPEMADYEVRREMLRAGLTESIRRLEALRSNSRLAFKPINSRAMRRAAELWAEARRLHLRPAGDREIDADAIIAAQSLDYVGAGDTLTVATPNVSHFRIYGIDAQPLDNITP